MLHLANAGTKMVIIPVSVATNATATGNIDTLGYDYVKVLVLLDTAASTSNNPVVCKLSESDDTVVTNFADVTGFVGDATDGFTIPNASASVGQVVEMNIDCRARKRYLKVSLTPGTAAQVMGAVAVMGRAESSTEARALAAAVVTG